ncbi:hypothetical protein BDY21DRAFT_93390 [Lineolata rhizophorae]|uniref:Uncharacterized protein n=1 Tax=Lineolata rhizophorae TaxID=578093 RepID=A0A6A6PCL1_9PEZI|nr:hypothetical protein BDY21DRAFT_93390 [Lineolata rhizophorae]
MEPIRTMSRLIRRPAAFRLPMFMPCIFLVRRFSTSRAFLDGTHLPRVAQSSFWASLIPKPFRNRGTDPHQAVASKSKPRSKDWNPSTLYIIYGILIGSQAIQTIAVKRDLVNFSRKADAKIELLREVIGRVQRGEEFDVDTALGTGIPQDEKEWEDGIGGRGYCLDSEAKEDGERIEEAAG